MHVVLTVDLDPETDGLAIMRFCDFMQQQEWTRIKLSNTFRARFEEQATRLGAIATARGDVRKAANAAGIVRYQVIAQVGPEAPSVWDEFHL